MKSLIILLLAAAPQINANIYTHILPLVKLFRSDQKLCSKLNDTLFQKLHQNESWEVKNDAGITSSSFELPGNLMDIEGSQSRRLVRKHFSFYDKDGELVLEMSTKLPRNADIDELMKDGTVKNIFPVNYQIIEYVNQNDGGYSDYFYLIEGERCKAEFSERSDKLVRKKCWSHPSLCWGPKLECLLNDDESTSCYNFFTGEGKKKDKPNEIHYSVNIGERIFWKTHLLMKDISSQNDLTMYRWKCTDEGRHVTCDQVDDRNGLANKNLFKRDQELCKKLNRSYFSGAELPKIEYEEYNLLHNNYTLPGNWFDVEGVECNDLVTKTFVFNYKGESSVGISTKLPRDADVNELMLDKTVRKIFPVNYKITDYEYNTHFLIEGERCKAQYDKASNKLINKRCWNTPSFCRGSRANCILNDDENRFCYDAYTGEGLGERKPGEVFYSMDIGERLYWALHARNYRDGENSDVWYYKWDCKDSGKYVFCDFITDGEYPLLILKTLSGHKG